MDRNIYTIFDYNELANRLCEYKSDDSTETKNFIMQRLKEIRKEKRCSFFKLCVWVMQDKTDNVINKIYSKQNKPVEKKRFVPTKRVALDGKSWWVVWDNHNGGYSTFVFHGRYKTKKECQTAININDEKFKVSDTASL